MAMPSVAEERKMPGEKKGSSGKKKGKEDKDADRWAGGVASEGNGSRRGWLAGAVGRGANVGRALACGVGRRVNWCAWLGHVQCAHRMKEKAMGKQAGAGKIERRKDGRGWAASGPVWEGKKNGD